MPGIVAFPHIVEAALDHHGALLGVVGQRQHLGEYRTDLLVAERKTILGINRELAHTTDQSCLNRFFNTVDWDPKALNERRLTLLQDNPRMRCSAHGIIPLDNILLDHGGEWLTDVAWFWDQAEHRYKIAHDYLFANYVWTSGKHYNGCPRTLPTSNESTADESHPQPRHRHPLDPPRFPACHERSCGRYTAARRTPAIGN